MASKPTKSSKESRAAAPTIAPAGFFALRTPLLPFDELSAFGAGLQAATAPPAELDSALAHDRQLLRQRLRALVARPEVLEALFIASPSLEESLPAWYEAPESERGQKVERSLVRYFTRMAARPTPFGLFAGCSLGKLGATTDLVIAARDAYRRHTRLDGDYLSALTDGLQRVPELRRALLYRPSSSLYRTGQTMRYVEGMLSGKERRRSYRLVNLEPSAAVTATLERATGGARLDELAQALVDGDADGDVTRAEADEFITELVDAQILVADLAPQVTGAEPIYDLVAQLRDARSDAAAPLADVQHALAALDASPLGAPPAAYRDVAGLLTPLPVAAELARLFQVDLTKPAPQATLGPEPIAEILRVIELQRRLRADEPSAALKRFATAFAARYESRQVPLAEVLDEDHGIGFDRSSAPSADVSPLLEGIVFAAAAGEPTMAAPDKLTLLLLQKADAALRDGAEEIVLSEAELQACAVEDPAPLPSSFSVMGTLCAASPEALAAGDYRLLLQACSGPSGANILGRFCHGDEELTALVREHLRAEEAERPDAVFAELVHLPQGRIGNILLRPLLRDHEISFLGRSGAPLDRQLQLDDLLVSLAGSRVVLYSRRLGKEVIPRLTSAHAFSNPGNLGGYQFLCALQQQDGALPHFDWGMLEHKSYLPRVRVGKVVLRAQRWRVRKADLAPLAEAKTAAARFIAAQELRRGQRLPRWVAVADGDNVLPIDLESSLAIDTLAQLVKHKSQLHLTELFGQNELCARGPEGAFTNELVIPMLVRAPRAAAETRPATTKAPAKTQPAPALTPSRPSAIVRSLPPGSDWLYAKLYCGSADADRILRDAIAPLVAELHEAGLVDSWFFIRYSDPDFHLRLRLHGDPERLMTRAYPLVCRAFAADLASGQAWKLQLDTYERELERYGGAHGMPLVEAIFAADSAAALAIVETLEGAAGAEARWKLTLRGIDQLLDDLGFGLAEKLHIMARASASFARELAGGGGLAMLDRQIGDRYRKERVALEALLDRGQDEGSEYAPGFAAFAERSTRLAPAVAALRAHAAAGRLPMPLEELAASLVHMHANRMFRGAARAQECVVYDFLTRLYQGRVARQKAR